MKKFIPGIYQGIDVRHNLIALSTDTESNRCLVFGQVETGPLRGIFTLVPMDMVVESLHLVEASKTPMINLAPRYPSIATGVMHGLYGHFKNTSARYNVIAIADSFESGEGWQVVYQPLYGEHRYAIRHRPLAMFTEVLKDRIVGDKIYNGPRFFKIEEISSPPHIVVEYQD